MKKVLLSLCVMLGSVSYAQVGTKNFIDQNYIEVVGKVEKEVTPNEIYVSVSIHENDYKNKSLSQLESSMIKELKSLGVDVEKDLRIVDMNSNFKKQLLKKNIVMDKNYQLILRDANTVVYVFQQLESIGISNISIEKVDHSDIEKLRKEVKIEAMKAAREKAVDLASAIGQEAGRAIYIQERDYGYPVVMSNTAVNYRLGVTAVDEIAGGNMPKLEFEKIKLAYSINAFFELK